MYIYPTETIYGLGVNALDEAALSVLFALKGRAAEQTVSWLVRDVYDIRRYAEVSEVAEQLITTFLPGPLTLVLPTLATVPESVRASDGTIGFRISSDPIAAQVVADFMALYDAPLTCTSANVSGLQPLATVTEIQQQFLAAGRTEVLTDWKIYDDGPRTGAASTVVRVVGADVHILRVGTVSEQRLKNCVDQVAVITT